MLSYLTNYFPCVVLAGAGVVVLGCLYCAGRFLEPDIHPLEPSYVKSQLPLVGHIMGFMLSGNRYLENVMRVDGIRTMNFGWKRAYIISSLDLITAVQRQSANISFYPVVKMMAECLSNMPPETTRIFDKDQSRFENKAGLSHDTLAAYHHAFGPGAGSQKLQSDMLKELLRLLSALDCSGAQGESRELYSWIKHTITHATMSSIYGRQHPFYDPVVESAFWDFELECGPLLMNFAPRLMAAKAMKARDVLDKAFAEYYTSGALDEASELAWARYRPPFAYGIPPQDIGRLESPFLFAVLATSVPACSWAFMEIHRRPDLLAELREELSRAVAITDAPNAFQGPRANDQKQKTLVLQIEQLKTSCPLILSVFQETLRRLSIFSLFRVVLTDTMLADRFLLKAGSLVMMPNNVIHNSSQVWGQRAGEFDPYRFMSDRGKIPGNHFRAFGDVPFRCPGRHFATTEIISILSLLIMKFDFEPHGNGGRPGSWTLPSPHLAVFGAIMPPKTDIIVNLRPRDGWQGHWSFELGDPKVKFPIVCG